MKRSFLTLLTIFFLAGNVLIAKSLENDKQIALEIFKHPETIEVKVWAKNINQPILGIAFDLQFDQNIASYEKYSPGNFLEQGGTPIYLISPTKNNPGTLVVGISLRRGDSLPQGSGQLISFFFKPKKSGQSALSFHNVSLASLDIKKRTIEDVNWIGGKMEIEKIPKGIFGKADLFTTWNATHSLGLALGIISVIAITGALKYRKKT